MSDLACECVQLCLDVHVANTITTATTNTTTTTTTTTITTTITRTMNVRGGTRNWRQHLAR